MPNWKIRFYNFTKNYKYNSRCKYQWRKYGAINNLLECYINVKKTNKNRITSYTEGKTKIKPAWYNCYYFEIVKQNIKNTILSIIINNNSKRVVGFKEIRHFDQTHLIDEFLELFPNTKIRYHIDDDIDRQCTSGWWTIDYKQHLTKFNDQL